ncbi:hypothetical protein [Dyadobacter sp. CY356]|uniref:hypothetical protein n=1 Tax=Dyadobacter sp. CY356 TaxID=2906442 RepID=UPI001F3540F3|nr:hypothetical protein [Dyadobacter sp. CY356]MCF0057252.1 hypothetical protein [Dyadobacter sp. CY356]
MKKILFVAAFIAFGLTNASAQYNGHDRDRDYNRDNAYQNNPRDSRGYVINDLQRDARRQISIGIERGTLNPREASALMHEYERIEARERKFSHRGGLNPREERNLIQDLERLMAQTRSMSSRRNNDNWARNPRGRY